MAFEYEGVLQALKNWMIANVVVADTGAPWFATDRVWTDPPTLSELTKFPAAVVVTPQALPTQSAGTLVMVYTIPVGIWTRESSSAAAGQKMRAILKAFDTAWADPTKVLDASLGNWALRTQINQQMEIAPSETDNLGAVTHFVEKRVQVWERIAARTF